MKVENLYDYMGRRVRKTVSSDYSGGSYTTTNVTAYVWDGFNIIAEMCDAGYTNWYTYGLDLSGTLQGAGGVGGALAMTRDTGTATNTYLYCFDGNGNVVNLVDASDGSIAATYEYSPFGSLIRSTGDMADVNPVRWSTKHTDDETGLVMYELRPYSPTLGGFISRDPISELGARIVEWAIENSGTLRTGQSKTDRIKAAFDAARKSCRNSNRCALLRRVEEALLQRVTAGTSPKQRVFLPAVAHAYAAFNNNSLSFIDRDGRDNWGPAPPWGGGNQNAPSLCTIEIGGGGSSGGGIFDGGVVDWTVGGIILSGVSDITCCDENSKKWKAKYTKICVGLAAELSAVGGGQIGVAGSNCPDGYAGSFIEFHGSIGPIAAGGCFSPDGSVGAPTVGIGLGGGVMWCEYFFDSAEEIGCCD